MEHVELRRRHAVDLAVDIRQREEVARRIEQEAAPREARQISDIHQRQGGVFRPSVCISWSRVSMARSAPKRVLAVSVAPCGVHREPIAFIAVRQRQRRHPVLDHHLDRRAVRFFHRRQRPAGLQGDALAPARQRIAQVVTLDA